MRTRPMSFGSHLATAPDVMLADALSPTTGAAASLLGRARRLHAMADDVNPVLAGSYRRRAAELNLEAWVRTVHVAPIEIDEFATVAAVGTVAA